MLEGELREVVVIEVVFYLIVVEYGSFLNKVYVLVRRFFRLYF